MSTQLDDSTTTELAVDAARLARTWDNLSLFKKWRIRTAAPDLAAALDATSATLYRAERPRGMFGQWTPFSDLFGRQ